jgi:hypothetical protein
MTPLQNVAVAAVIFLPVSFAGDFWKDKAPTDWSDKEVSRMMTSSPWAKQVSVQMGGAAGGGMRGGGGGRGRGGGGGMGGMGGGGMGAGGGMGGGGGAGMGGRGIGGGGEEGIGGGGGGMGGGGGAPVEVPKMTVRWESAIPVREAAVKTEAAAKDVDQWSKEFYVITVGGGRISMGGAGGRRGGERPQPDPARMQQMQDRFKEATTLKRKGKDPIQPARVERLQTPEGSIMAFLFPRSEAIDLDDKEVTFETAIGPMEVKSKFNLKDMVYKGKLSL